MRKDFHIHPNILAKPETFSSFVEYALKNQIGEICITDHMPLSVSKAKDRIGKGCVKEYCTRVRGLAAQYEDVIRIRCGIEIDFHPSVKGEIEEVLADGDFDWILGSTHMHLFIRDYERYTPDQFAHAALCNTLQAVQSGLFDAISHFDMFRFPFTDPARFPFAKGSYQAKTHMDLICQILDEMKKQNLHLEINPHLAEQLNDTVAIYPAPEIVGAALDRNLLFSYGSDAHAPASVGAFLDTLEAHPVYGKALKSWESMPD